MGAAVVLMLVGLGALAAGVLIGRYYVPDDRQLRRTARHSRAYMRALSHLIERDHDTVLEELRGVVEENVDDVEPYFALGAMFRSKGEHERAIRVHQALAVRERDKKKLRQRAMYELGLDFRAAGMPRRATRAMEEVLLEEPNHEGALRALAALYEEQARFNEAAGLWARLGKRRNEDTSLREHHLLVAAAQSALGRDDADSAKQLLKAAQRQHETAHFFAAAAELAAARGNHRGAKERLKQALVADPALAPHLLPGLIAAEAGLAVADGLSLPAPDTDDLDDAALASGSSPELAPGEVLRQLTAGSSSDASGAAISTGSPTNELDAGWSSGVPEAVPSMIVSSSGLMSAATSGEMMASSSGPLSSPSASGIAGSSASSTGASSASSSASGVAAASTSSGSGASGSSSASGATGSSTSSAASGASASSTSGASGSGVASTASGASGSSTSGASGSGAASRGAISPTDALSASMAAGAGRARRTPPRGVPIAGVGGGVSGVPGDLRTPPRGVPIVAGGAGGALVPASDTRRRTPPQGVPLVPPQRPHATIAERVLAVLAEVEAETGPRLEIALIRAHLVPPTDDRTAAELATELVTRFPDALAARVATARLALRANDVMKLRAALEVLVADHGALAWALRGRWQCSHCGNRPGPFSWRCGQCRRWNTLRMETGIEPPPLPPRERRSAPRVSRPEGLLGSAPDESLPAATLDPGLSDEELARAGTRRSLLGRVGGWFSNAWRRDR